MAYSSVVNGRLRGPANSGVRACDPWVPFAAFQMSAGCDGPGFPLCSCLTAHSRLVRIGVIRRARSNVMPRNESPLRRHAVKSRCWCDVIVVSVFG